MTTEQMIEELYRVADDHKNDIVGVGELNIHAMCMDVANRLQELLYEKPKVNKWIPVSERLPAINGQYLCQIKGFLKNAWFDVLCFSDDLYSVSEYDFHKYRGKKKKSGFYDYDSEWGHFEVEDVVAWMPLPEPYKKEGAE